MKNIMLAGILLITLSCARVPKKPVVDLCIIDLPRNQLICASTDEDRISYTDYTKAREYIMAQKEIKVIPLGESDKYVCFSPKHWQSVNIYLKKLRDYAVNMCQ